MPKMVRIKVTPLQAKKLREDNFFRETLSELRRMKREIDQKIIAAKKGLAKQNASPAV